MAHLIILTVKVDLGSTKAQIKLRDLKWSRFVVEGGGLNVVAGLDMTCSYLVN